MAHTQKNKTKRTVVMETNSVNHKITEKKPKQINKNKKATTSITNQWQKKKAEPKNNYKKQQKYIQASHSFPFFCLSFLLLLTLEIDLNTNWKADSSKY